MDLPVLLVFSSLRWSSTVQRTHHLVSRLAGRWHVLFVEEPVCRAGPSRLAVSTPRPNVQVLVPHTPLAAPGFHDEQLVAVGPLLADHLDTHALQPRVAWLGTPMALPWAVAMRPGCVLYDATRSYDAAALPVRQRERALVGRADLVLAPGPSAYEWWRRRHACVQYVPDGVDAERFAPSSLRPGDPHARAAEGLQGALPHPRLGLFGVIDERIDLALVDRLAAERPRWQFVLAGPVVGLAYGELPRRDNLHWLGAQPYARLPHLLAGWDIALLPVALGAATQHACPTEVLEYLAGEKPVVGTAAGDLVSLYGHAIEVARDGAAGLAEACERVLRESRTCRLQRAQTMLGAVATQSWDRRADEVHALMQAALAGTLRPVPAHAAHAARAMAAAPALLSDARALQA